VQRLKLKRAEDEEVERALKDFGWLAHAAIISTLDIDCQDIFFVTLAPRATPFVCRVILTTGTVDSASERHPRVVIRIVAEAR
jgi:hypothetical protein